MFDNKSILITSGTGSFGRQAVKTIVARFRPTRVVVFSRDERTSQVYRSMLASHQAIARAGGPLGRSYR